MGLKKRDWKDHAWELCRQKGCPGDVALAEAAMEFAYQLGLSDATKEFKVAIDAMVEKKTRSNHPK